MASCNCLSQDSINVKVPFEYVVKGKQIINSRNSKIINSNQTVADNPLVHFAIYGGIILKPNYRKKYSVDIGIYFEERNHSAGNNTLDHLVFYPKLTFKITDTLQVFGKKLKIKAKAGDLWNEDFNDIVRFYNIDFNGLMSKVGYKKIWLSLYRIGDLSYNIGLGLNEVSKLELSYQNTRILTTIHFTRNSIDITPKNDNNYGLYLKAKITNIINFKFQLDGRSNTRIGKGVALGAQVVMKYEKQKFKIGYQHYSKDYNEGYFQSDKVDYNTNFLNFTGTQLYPLKNYFRPINQWALFTSFQGSHIHNLEIQYSIKNDLYKKLYYIANVDINLLHNSASNQLLLFPAYEIGFGLNFGELISLELSSTNKHMNLNRVYQGHSLSELPFMSVTLSMNN